METINPDIKNKIDNYINNNKIPHIIFYGPVGSQKVDAIHYLINTAYKNDKESIQKNVLHVNCSHGKGIQFIRNELKFFAKININTFEGQNFKSIVLFNADKLTTDAQSALRRCIEQFSNSTRFFIMVNKKEQLLKPILSRFCKIYVPHYEKKDCEMSPFEKTLQKYENNKINWLQKNILKYWKHKNRDSSTQGKNENKFKEMVDFSEKIYNKGYSVLDLIEIIKNLRIEKEKKLHYLLFFQKHKKEFRNEKLLIFFILFLIKVRPIFDIQNISSI